MHFGPRVRRLPAPGAFLRQSAVTMHKLASLDREIVDSVKLGVLFGAAVLVLVLPPRPPTAAFSPLSATPAASPAVSAISQHDRAATIAPIERKLDLAGYNASDDVRQIARWIVASADNGSQPFVVIDKRNTRVYVFEPSGRLRGATPVLLGHAPGDDSVAGIGLRPIAEVRPEERTTPAGRFDARPGRNAGNEDVLWVDYDAAVSMHRVRLNNPAERRLERLASPTTSDNRISYGCINMPPAFFNKVLWPRFREHGGPVYVLPEVKPLAAVFPAAAGIIERAGTAVPVATGTSEHPGTRVPAAAPVPAPANKITRAAWLASGR